MILDIVAIGIAAASAAYALFAYLSAARANAAVGSLQSLAYFRAGNGHEPTTSAPIGGQALTAGQIETYVTRAIARDLLRYDAATDRFDVSERMERAIRQSVVAVVRDLGCVRGSDIQAAFQSAFRHEATRLLTTIMGTPMTLELRKP